LSCQPSERSSDYADEAVARFRGLMNFFQGIFLGFSLAHPRLYAGD
jgi:hypothetical protein